MSSPGGWWSRLLSWFGRREGSDPREAAPRAGPDTGKVSASEARSKPAQPPPRVSHGADAAPTPSRTLPRTPSRTPLDLHLGIDFGTRFTKVCVRDIGREKSWLVSFSRDPRPDVSHALVPSVVRVVGGRITLGRAGSQATLGGAGPGLQVDFLKLLLAQLDGGPAADVMVRCPDGYDDRAIEGLAAFYLAHVIQRARRWVEEQHAELLVGREPQWSTSVGVPVQVSNSPAKPRFQRVLETAVAWADLGVASEISMADLRLITARLQREPSSTPCDVVPEITAAIRSFVAAPGAPEGVYLYLDVGAGTLEGVSFRFDRSHGRLRLDLYCGCVEPLGVSALALRLASSMATPVEGIEARLMDGRVSDGLRRKLASSESQLRQLVAKVILAGKRIEPDRWSAGLEQVAQAFHKRQRFRDSRAVPLFIGGGGSLSPFYRSTVESTYDVNRLERANVRRYALADIPQPADLDMAGVHAEHFHRFAIAYGLSIPRWELPEDLLPSDEGLPPPSRKPSGRSGVTPYEDTKDAFC